MHVLILRDRRPGHYHQAEGLAAIITRTLEATVERIDLRPRIWARNRVRKLLLEYARQPGRWLRAVYGVRLEALSRPDIVIGCGRPTAMAGILIARATGARFIYSGFLFDYDLSEIDLVLVRARQHADQPNCVLAPIPTMVDPDAMRAPRRLCSRSDLKRATVSLFLGGDGPGYRYREAEWRRVAELVADSASKYGILWEVSNSRRTPHYVSGLFCDLEKRGDVVRFVDYNRSGPGSASSLFATDAIVTTEDSLTMLAEAMAARRPVVALRPQAVTYRPSADEIATMAESGGLAVLPIRSASPEQLANHLTELRVPEGDPRDVLAAAIAPMLDSSEPGRLKRSGPRRAARQELRSVEN